MPRASKRNILREKIMLEKIEQFIIQQINYRNLKKIIKENKQPIFRNLEFHKSYGFQIYGNVNNFLWLYKDGQKFWSEKVFIRDGKLTTINDYLLSNNQAMNLYSLLQSQYLNQK